MRDSIRLATLAQAISSTQPTAPSSTSSVGRAPQRQLVAEADRHGREARARGVEARVVGLQPARDRGDVGPRLLQRGAGLQAPVDVQHAGAAVLARRALERNGHAEVGM